MPNFKTIELRDEVELINGTKTKTIQMREPTRGDLKFAMKIKDEVEQNDKLIERLSSIAVDSLDTMALCDNDRLLLALEDLKAGNIDPKS